MCSHSAVAKVWPESSRTSRHSSSVVASIESQLWHPLKIQLWRPLKAGDPWSLLHCDNEYASPELIWVMQLWHRGCKVMIAYMSWLLVFVAIDNVPANDMECSRMGDILVLKSWHLGWWKLSLCGRCDSFYLLQELIWFMKLWHPGYEVMIVWTV